MFLTLTGDVEDTRYQPRWHNDSPAIIRHDNVAGIDQNLAATDVRHDGRLTKSAGGRDSERERDSGARPASGHSVDHTGTFTWKIGRVPEYQRLQRHLQFLEIVKVFIALKTKGINPSLSITPSEQSPLLILFSTLFVQQSHTDKDLMLLTSPAMIEDARYQGGTRSSAIAIDQNLAATSASSHSR